MATSRTDRPYFLVGDFEEGELQVYKFEKRTEVVYCWTTNHIPKHRILAQFFGPTAYRRAHKWAKSEVKAAKKKAP